MLRNIIIKILKNKNKEKMLEAIREKQSGVLEVYTVLNDWISHQKPYHPEDNGTIYLKY